ncbi:MAG: hypothetical protein J6B34_03745 [Clostridia bacterium]|nr:hypothetical protein [Clostridia bacterium]
MKKAIILILFLTLLVCLCSCSGEVRGERVEFQKTGNCVHDNIWEIAEYDNALFFGTGDGNANTGPTTIWAYSLSEDRFFESGVLNEEVINRFVIIDGTLVAPGIDPTEKNKTCNYNYYENGEWKRYRNIYPTQHCLDIIKYKDHVLYGVDGELSFYTVFMSTDGGESYKKPVFYKNGEQVFGMINGRVYDFVEFKGELYAFLTLGVNTKSTTVDIYKYDYENVKFDYFSSITDQVIFRHYVNFSPIGSKVVSDNCVYIATPLGYYTKDMKVFEKINIDESKVLFDYCVDGDTLYALCSKIFSDGSCETSVLSKNLSSDEEFKELFYFNSEYYCLSFIKNGNTFFFGTADVMGNGSEKGAVLTVEWSK